MATIRKNRDKWQVLIRRKGIPNLSRVFRRKADALEWANLTEAAADRGGLPTDPKVLERLTVADVMKRYRDHIIPTKRGCEIETIIIHAFLRSPMVNTRLSDLTAGQIAAYRDERLKTVRPATIKSGAWVDSACLRGSSKRMGHPAFHQSRQNHLQTETR